MYYIKYDAENGNHGNPASTYFSGAVGLPDELLDDYVAAMGFARLTVEDETVVSVERDDEAYYAYISGHPEPEPEEPEPTPDDDRDAMLVDLEYRVTLLELGVNDDALQDA